MKDRAARDGRYRRVADPCRITQMGTMKLVAAWTAMALSTLPLWIGGGCGSDSTESGTGGSAGSGSSTGGSTGGSSSGTAGDTSGTAGTTTGTSGSTGSGGSVGTGGSTGSGGSGLAACSYFAPNGYCPGTLKCRCCMTLGAQNCTCSTACMSNPDCSDPSRPSCVEGPAFGFCAPAADFCKAH
ncbi:MAG TPA: hypothetical protein VF881_12695 [Polyangiaceae bacterium]